MASASTGAVRNGSIHVEQSKVTGCHFGWHVGHIRQLTVWSRVLGLAGRKEEDATDNTDVLHRKYMP